MRDVQLFDQYLVRERQRWLLLSHRALIADPGEAAWARIYAFKAELVEQTREALKLLDKDPGEFIKQYLERGET